MKSFTTVLLFCFPFFLQGQSVILQNVNVIDVVNDEILTNQSIQISDGIIQKIQDGILEGDEVDSTIDLRNKFIIPGLIDCHTHIEHSGYWDQSQKYNPPRENLVELLSHALHGGITTIREMACDVRVVGELARAAKVDLIESPDIFYPSLFAGPPFFEDPRADAGSLGEKAGEVSWFRGIDNQSDLPNYVAQAKGNGSTALKLYALLKPSQIKSIVDEAHSQNLKVWAHFSTQFSKPSEVIDSGVDGVSHAPMIFNELGPKPDYSVYPANDSLFEVVFEKMRENNVSFDPTIFVFDAPARKHMVENAKMVTQKAHEAGVMIVAGTDSISAYRDFELPNIHREIAYYANECNFSTMEALKTATINPAITLGMEDEFGSIEESKKANLIVLNKNPLDDIKNTESIYFVMKNGKIYQRE